MAKLSILVGSTSQTVNVFVQDSSATTGAGLTGLVFNTSGLTCYYVLPKAASAAVSLATLAAVTSAWATGGFKEIDATNCPGLYRLDLPNAVLASGRFATVYLRGATNMAQTVLEIELTAVDNQDAVHGGMSALPNTACTTNASLLTSGAGTDQLSVTSGRIDLGKWLGTAASAPTVAGVPNVNVKTWNDLTTVALPLVPATAGRTLVVDAAGLADANVVKLGPTGSGAAQTARDVGASVLVAGDLSATMKTSVQTAADAAVTANSLVIAIAGYIDTEVAAIKTQTDKLTFSVANQLDVNVLDWKGSAAPAMTGDAFARLGAAGAGLTALGDSRIAHLDADVSTRLPTSSYTSPPSAATIAAAVWAYVVEGTYTAVNYMVLFASVLLGKASGLGTATGIYRDTGDTKPRVSAGIDADGNRSSVTLDPT